MVETELVEVEDRRFFCPKCGDAWDVTIYPSDDAWFFSCFDCDESYVWSRKLKKLFNQTTREELDPGYFIIYGTRLVEQLKTPSQ